MRLTRRSALQMLGLGAAAAALAPTESGGAAPVDPIAEAFRQSVAGANAMTAATGETWVTVPENLLERNILLGRLRGRNEMRAEMERERKFMAERVVAVEAPYGYIMTPPSPAIDPLILLDGPTPIDISPMSMMAVHGEIRPATREEFEASMLTVNTDTLMTVTQDGLKVIIEPRQEQHA